MKRFLVLSVLIFTVVLGLSAEGGKLPTIAIMDVAATNTSDVKSQVIYEYIVDVVNRSHRYTIVERSALQSAIKEMEISASGMVDDSTAARIGKLAGAELILISNLIVDDGITYLSTRIVSVETGQVNNTAMLQKGGSEYIASLANRTVSQLLGEPEAAKPETASVSNETVAEKDKSVTAEEKPKEQLVKVENKDTPKAETVSKPVRSGSKLSVSIAPLAVLPVLDDSEIFDIGYGINADFNYRILSLSKGILYAGVGTGVSMDTASVKKGVIYPYNMLSIPFFLNIKYKINFGKFFAGVKIAGGGVFSMFMYTETSPTAETTVTAVTPAISPGLSIGYSLSKKIQLSVFSDWSMIFFKTYPYTALNTGLAVDINL